MTTRATARCLVVVGAGGTIGSHLVEHAGRMERVSTVVLIDDGTYEAGNERAQAIDQRDIGRRKVDVQAARLERMRPDLNVTAIARRVEDVPLGVLREADVILTGLDSKASRRFVNDAAWRSGTPWIDAAVQAHDSLVRVRAFVPRADASCLECAWTSTDYATLEQRYPCAEPKDGDAVGRTERSHRPEPPSTGAPSELGALAAALEAIECSKLLAAGSEAAVGRQVMLDAEHHRLHDTAFAQQDTCRLDDHAPWSIERLDLGPDDVTVLEAFDLGAAAGSGQLLHIYGRSFAIATLCDACGAIEPTLAIVRSDLGARFGQCPCGGDQVTTGFHVVDALERATIADTFGSTRLRAIGVVGGDVLTVIGPAGTTRHFELR